MLLSMESALHSIRSKTNSLRFHRSRYCGIESNRAVRVDSKGVSYVVFEIDSWREIKRWYNGY